MSTVTPVTLVIFLFTNPPTSFSHRTSASAVLTRKLKNMGRKSDRQSGHVFACYLITDNTVQLRSELATFWIRTVNRVETAQMQKRSTNDTHGGER